MNPAASSVRSSPIIGIDASRAFRAERTGTERYALEIIRHLLRLDPGGRFRWRLYVDHAPPYDLIDLDCPDRIQLCPLKAQRMWTHTSLAREMLQNPPDVLFVPAHVIPFMWPRTALFSRRLPPSVVTVHDLGYRHFSETHNRRQRTYLDWSTRWNVHAAQQVIAVSQATKQDLEELYHVPPHKITVVHEAGRRPNRAPSAGGYGPVEFDSANTSQPASTSIVPADGKPYALFVGTIQPRKNVERLLRAYAKLVQAHSIGWDLVLAGKAGWLSQPLYQLPHELGLDQRVHFLGFVPDDDLPGLFQQARFFCFPSLYEGFGLPVLEAQHYGVPVMTSNNSSLPEVAGDAAILVDPMDVDAIAEAMLRLSQDEELRQRLIVAGHENVKRFSWEKAARETLAVLEAAMKKDE